MLRTLQTVTNILSKNSGKSILKFCPKAMTIFKLCRLEIDSANDKKNLAMSCKNKENTLEKNANNLFTRFTKTKIRYSLGIYFA